jgi:hypothetical protein
VRVRKKQDFSTSFGGALAQDRVIQSFCALIFKKERSFRAPLCSMVWKTAPFNLPSSQTSILSDTQKDTFTLKWNQKFDQICLSMIKRRALVQVRSCTVYFGSETCAGICASVGSTKATAFP